MSATTVGAVVSRPDPEVRPVRQSYPAGYKLKILAELDAADSSDVTRGRLSGDVMKSRDRDAGMCRTEFSAPGTRHAPLATALYCNNGPWTWWLSWLWM